MNSSLKKLIFGLGFAILSLSIGISGYMLIEDYSFTEALYMTVITISTVGYREARPLSEAGMIFTSIYILLNLGLVAYVVTYVARFVFEGELKHQYDIYINEKKLKAMKNHVIVCGYGRNGSKAVAELKRNGHQCVVIDMRAELAEELINEVKGVVIGDASDENVLAKAGLPRAKAIIIALPNDAQNVYITLTAREVNPDIQIISRATSEQTQKKLYKAGAHTVVMPDSLGGKHMAQLITKPSVIHFLNLLEGVEGSFKIEQINYDDLKPEYQGKSIVEMNIRQQTGVSVVANQNKNGSFQINPKADTVLQPGANFIILGTNDEIGRFQEIYLQHKFAD